MREIKCSMCGACCIAYDISTLSKPAGTACKNLSPSGTCEDYTNRPAVCREFKPDELCVLISVLPLSQKINVIRKVYDI